MDEKRFVKALWIAKAALLAVLVYVGFEVATSRLNLGAVFVPGAANGKQQTAEEPTALPQTREFSDYTAIIQRNLFTEAEAASGARAAASRAQAPESPAPVDELGLKLVGAIAGGSVASRALIQDAKTNATRSYRIGDTVASATVEAIQRDAVILRCQGRPLVLKLRPGTAADNPSKVSAPSDPSKDKLSGTKDTSGAGGTNAPTPPSNRVGYMGEVLRKATIEPYVRNDQTEGLRITGLENIPLAEMFGLKNGDIVQSINGQELTSKQKAFQVLQKAKTQSKVNLQLLRDGKSKFLSFDL